MKQLRIICLIFLSTLTGSLFAQDRPVYVLFSGYLTMPTGDFGKEIGELARLTRRSGFFIGDKIGLAKTGYGFGVDLIIPLKFKGFDWLVSCEFLTNPQNSETIEPYFEDLASDSATRVDLLFDLGNHMNIPFMTGIRYSYLLSSDFGFYLQVKTGINFTKAGSIKAETKEVVAEETTYQWAQDFGFELGLGIDLFRKLNLGVSYLFLNTPRFEGTRILSEKFFPGIRWRINPILGETRSISMVRINLGYYLFKN